MFDSGYLIRGEYLSVNNSTAPRIRQEQEDLPMFRSLLAFSAFILVSSASFADDHAEGDWDFSMASPFGQVSAKVSFDIDGDTLTGGFDLGDGRVLEILEGKVEGDKLTFSITREGAMTMTYVMEATVTGDSVSGVAAAMGTTAPWSMTRAN